MSSADTRAVQLQREGQVAYRNKDYTKAIKLFSQALEIPRTTTAMQLRILDNRAAAKEKAGNELSLKGALADARQMIKLQKTYVNGYLRTGKILQLQGCHQNALNLYKYGLEKLESSDENGKELLEKMYEKVHARVEPPKAKKVDMMTVLPVELLDMIIQYIPFPSLILAQGVSKSWRNFLINSSKTYVELDFSSAKKPLSRSTVMLAAQHTQNNVRKAVFNRLEFRGVQPLIHLATLNPGLTELQLLGYEQPLPVVDIVKHTENLRKLIIKSAVRTQVISQILAQCRSLECFECFDVDHMGFRGWTFENKSNLKRLYLRIVKEEYQPSDQMLPALVAHLPELRELEVSEYGPRQTDQLDLTAAPHLTVLRLRKVAITVLPLLPRTIKHLTLARLPNLNIVPDDILKSPLPALQELDLSYNPNIRKNTLLLLLDSVSPRKLVLDMCPRLDFGAVDWLLPCGSKLEELSVVGNSTFGDSVSKEMAGFKMLKRLDIGNTKITGIGLLNLIRMSQKEGSWGGLQYVGCDMCEGVGHDAVDVARKMGVTVSHRMLTEYGGKKVRYSE